MSIFPRPLKKVLDKIIPFSQEDKVPLFNLGSGTYDATTFLRGDGTWATPAGGSGSIPHGTASGTDTYTVTIAGVTAYNDGDAFLVRFLTGNTTGCTLNINGLGARTLYRNNDGVLIGGDIVDGAEMLCVYNSTTSGFQTIGTAPNTLISYVTNADSVTITKGQPVYAFGGQGDRLTVKLANNSSDATSAQTVGLVISTSIGVNQKGLIMVNGLLDGLSILPTSTWADGDAVYLGTTAGSITNVKPVAPNHLVYLGFVTTASNGAAGRMYVRVQNGYELQELHNVYINPATLSDNNLIQYDSATLLWKNESLSTAGIQPTLVSGTNIKTINGNTLLGSGDITVGSSSGRFGIADSNGVYTYYSTFTLAMTAATAGQTIEMFADVVETGAVEITLKNGVNINGNGHTYTLNNNGNIQAFKTANSVSIECSILNLNVIRTGSTGTQSLNNALFIGTSTSGNIYLNGSRFINSGSGSGIGIGGSSTISIYNAIANANTSFGSIYFESSSGARAYNSIGISSTGAGINCYIGGDLYNCTGISSSGIGIDGAGATTAGNQYNCIGISTTNQGFTSGLTSTNCIGRSVSGNGFSTQTNSRTYSCIGISVSGRGVQNTGGIMYNFQGISSSNVGILLQSTSSLAYNCYSVSDSSYSIWGWQGSRIYNSIIECRWNNAGGNGIQGISGFITSTIVNCLFRLSNSSAPYLNNGGTAQAISMRGNTYQGGAAFNINLTQAIVSTEDNQGNIFL
jgi:hypothetical protein